jgi:molybdenum cofactor synthesis domain-containing protein
MTMMTLRAAILICSDRAYDGQRFDRASAALAETLKAAGWTVAEPETLPDDQEMITEWLQSSARNGSFDLIITSGGTGTAPRDVTPEATLKVIEKRVPGIEEAMRAASLKITPNAMLSRAVAGITGKTLIINLPGSPKGAVENLEVVLPALPHAVALLRGEKPDP